MLEINDHTRLIKHTDQWIAQQLIATESSYRRPIWKPITRLLNTAEAECWLTREQVPAGVIARFKQASQAAQA